MPSPRGYFGAQLPDIVEGDTAIVFGAGPIGLSAARSCWLMGAGRAIVVDDLEYRLRKAEEFTYAETINFGQVSDLVRVLKKATGDLGADVVIDAVGAEADGHVARHVTAAKLKLEQRGADRALAAARGG